MVDKEIKEGLKEPRDFVLFDISNNPDLDSCKTACEELPLFMSDKEAMVYVKKEAPPVNKKILKKKKK